jgi:drug/metabolite transporter (DMT)-like permease
MWGSTFLLIKVAVPTVPAFTMAAVRGLLAAALLWAVIAASRRGARTSKEGWTPAIVLGTLSGWFPNVLTAWALLRLASADAGMLSAAGPIFVVILAHFFLKSERLHATQFAGVVIGFVGVALIIGFDPAAVRSGDLYGELAMIAVAISYASGTVYSRWIGPQDAPRLAMRQQLVAGLFTVPVAFAIEQPWNIRPEPVAIIAIVGLAIWASAIPIWLYFRLIAHARAVTVSLVAYLTPAVAVVLGVLVLGEKLEPSAAIGLAVVFAGVAITTRRRRPAIPTSAIDPGSDVLER